MVKHILLLFCLLFSIHGIGQDFYDIPHITEIRITFSEPDWDTILDSLKQTNAEENRLIASVKVDGIQYDSVGVRYKGNSSYFNVRNAKKSKLPFNIKCNHIRKKQTFKDGFKTLKLSNVFRDPSFLREVISYEIGRNYMPASKANFAKVYVNNQYLGLYNNTESVDKDFLKRNFGDSKGVFVKCDPNWNATKKNKCPKGDKASLMYLGKDSLCYEGLYELKSKKGWKELVELTRVLNKEVDKIEGSLNVDQVLWMHAFNNVLVNLDSYSGRLCHNYYLYQDTFGVFNPILWDMNLSLGGFRYDGTGSPLSDEKMQKLSPFVHYKSPNRPLISQLLTKSLYRKMYIAHIKTIIKDYFSNNKYQSRSQTIHQLIDRHVREDGNKLYTHEAFKKNIRETALADKSKIIGINELMAGRVAYLNAHPLLTKEVPVISNVRHQKEGEKVYVSAKAPKSKNVWLAYRTAKNGPFKRVKMKDDGATGDQLTGDETYGFSLAYKAGTQYYIIAEMDKTAALSPERASFKFHEIP